VAIASATTPARSATPLNALSAAEIAGKIAAGETTCEAVARDCLARIAARDGAVKAWVNFDADRVLARARELDRAPVRGPLHGVPVGVKDTIDTFDMPTEMGSPIYRGYRPAADAACVALLRRAGALILGKTATCEFAGSAPPDTTNPHNSAHTPGGSSSGSGAAVADHMMPAALGTQTGGSILRPSSFCGVFGYKPTYNTINKAGTWPAADSIDTIGWLARSIDDIEMLTAVQRMEPPPRPRPLSAPPRIGLCRTELWDTAQDETKAAVEQAAQHLAGAKAIVREVELPDAFSGLHVVARSTVNCYERAACMAFAWDHHRQQLSPQMHRYIESGQKISRDAYVAGLQRLDRCRALLAEVFDAFDVLLVPCVPGEAPKGLEATGDPAMQAVWTALHTPTMTLPTHRGPNNLPVGIQLVAQRYDDDRLFACARWIWQAIGSPEMVGCRL
jgi:Asp-tRNA(Asn)/Glu-tRNA(Gln) amidotransferase A subunit family amidase